MAQPLLFPPLKNVFLMFIFLHWYVNKMTLTLNVCVRHSFVYQMSWEYQKHNQEGMASIEKETFGVELVKTKFHSKWRSLVPVNDPMMVPLKLIAGWLRIWWKEKGFFLKFFKQALFAYSDGYWVFFSFATLNCLCVTACEIRNTKRLQKRRRPSNLSSFLNEHYCWISHQCHQFKKQPHRLHWKGSRPDFIIHYSFLILSYIYKYSLLSLNLFRAL